MLTARTIGMELLRACVVLALVFLSFAHSPPTVSADPHSGPAVVAEMDWCGGAPDTGSDGKAAHSPCHACRLGAGADLPPPCPVPLGLQTVADVHYGALQVLRLPAAPAGHASARGPPLA